MCLLRENIKEKKLCQRSGRTKRSQEEYHMKEETQIWKERTGMRGKENEKKKCWRGIVVIVG